MYVFHQFKNEQTYITRLITFESTDFCIFHCFWIKKYTRTAKVREREQRVNYYNYFSSVSLSTVYIKMNNNTFFVPGTIYIVLREKEKEFQRQQQQQQQL